MTEELFTGARPKFKSQEEYWEWHDTQSQNAKEYYDSHPEAAAKVDELIYQDRWPNEVHGKD